MPTGQEHVQAARQLCEGAADGLRAFGDDAADEWTSDALTRLDAVQRTLVEVQDRFFLRSKLCLPFAARCEQAARRLQAALGEPGPDRSTDALQEVSEALVTLEVAAITLDERSGAQGMTIT